MPYKEPNFDVKGAKVGLWEITESAETIADPEVLSGHEIRKALTFRSEPNRLLHLAGRRCLRQLAGLNDRHIIYNDNRGMPKVVPSVGYISLAHTQGMAVAMHSTEAPVAIDVESLQRHRNLSIRKMFMNPQEEQWFTEHEDLLHFLFVWCAKECLYKLHSEVYSEISFQRELSLKVEELTALGEGIWRLEGGFSRDEFSATHQLEIRRVGAYIVAFNLPLGQ